MTESDFSTFGTILLGGVVTLMGALFVSSQEAKRQRKLAQQELLLKKKALGLSLIVKLSDQLAWSMTTKQMMDDFFDTAAADGRGDLEPAQKVLKLVGVQRASYVLEVSELALILETRDNGLLEEVRALCTRFETALELANELNERRVELEGFVQEAQKGLAPDKGQVFEFKIPLEEKGRLDLHISVVNSLVGDLMEQLSQDVSRLKLGILRVVTSVNSIEGVKLPEVSFVDD